jgi:sugar/nucleoside kinase (ribokinase family)
MSRIACLGVLVADVVGKPIDALPKRGTLELIDRIELHIGGNAANTAGALARLGPSARLVGKVGDDNFGAFLVGALERLGVDTRAVARATDGTPTPCSLVTVHSDAERSFLHAPGTNATLTEADIAWELLEGVQLFHVAGLQLLVALEGEGVGRVLAAARARGMTTLLDTVMNPRSQGWAGLAPALPHLDWFVPSFEEVRALTGETTVEAQVAMLRAHGASNVAVKCGGEGCYIAPHEGAAFTVPSFAVPVVDTLGAGDSWCAGFLTGLLHDWPLERTARFANAVGACCVQALGATPGIRTVDETLALYFPEPRSVSA